MKRTVQLLLVIVVQLMALIVGLWPSRSTLTTALHPPRIAFMTDRGGNFKVCLMESDGSNPVNLTLDRAEDGLPAWSARAGALAFLSTRDAGELAAYRMDVDGGNSLALSRHPPADDDPPTWSPTGEWVASGSHADGNAAVLSRQLLL